MRRKVWTKAITFGSWFRIGMSLAVGLSCTSAALGDGRLFPGAQYPVASSPRSLVVGDLNGDEVPDLAVANVGFHGALSVLLGVGDGTFAGAVHYDAGDGPIFVAMGDLNGDKKPDLAAVNFRDDSVSVLMGIGDGTLTAAVHYPVGQNPIRIVIGDVDVDGVSDLVVSYSFYQIVSVLLGLGDGLFAASHDFSVGKRVGDIALGDLDGDDIPDLAVANIDTDTVGVLVGNGDGTFGTAVRYPTGDGPNFVAIGDLDGDDVPDLAVSNSLSDDVSVLLGRGGGTFESAMPYSVGDEPNAVTIGDMDGDEVPDLAVTNRFTRDVSVLLGRGDGSFVTAVEYYASSSPNSPVISDLNDDEVPDLIMVTAGNTVTTLMGVGDGTFVAARRYGSGNSDNRRSSLAIGDLNGDQAIDIAVVHTTDKDISVLLGAGDGTFVTVWRYSIDIRPYSIAIGDLNGDEVPDMVVTVEYGSAYWVLLGVCDGTFEPAVRHDFDIPSTSYRVALGDLNGDEVVDVVVTARVYAVPSYDNVIAVELGVGDGTFFPGARYTAGDLAFRATIGDLNGDRLPDLAVPIRGAEVSVRLGQGDGTFSEEANYSTGGGSSVAIGDLNGDQVPDLAVGQSILLGVGDGTFLAHQTYAGGGGDVKIGDINGDQIPDLASWNWQRLNATVLLGIGDGTFSAPLEFSVASSQTTLGLADLNGDRMLDLVLPTAGLKSVAVLLNQFSRDCVGNGIPDACDIDCGPAGGSCDLPGCGISVDCNGNGIPDECEMDCNENGVPDDCDSANGDSPDCNCNGIPDECEIDASSVVDCTAIPGVCDDGPFFCTGDCVSDANANGIPDCCDGGIGPSSCPDCCAIGENLVEVFFVDRDSRCFDDRPNNCAIDAREPHDIRDAAARKGWDRMVMSFACNVKRSSFVPGDFTVSVVPGGAAPRVSSVVFDGEAQTITVMLDDMIPPGQWTCIAHPGSGSQWCVGYLPADAGQDGLSAVADIMALINAINLVPGLELPIYATDVNRSGVTNGQDILRLIDLLNGAGDFDPWIAQGLPPCPSVGNGR